MPYITLPIIFIICFAIAACIAHIHRGRVRRKKEERESVKSISDDLFQTVENFDPKFFKKQDFDAFDRIENNN